MEITRGLWFRNKSPAHRRSALRTAVLHLLLASLAFVPAGLVLGEAGQTAELVKDSDKMEHPDLTAPLQLAQSGESVSDMSLEGRDFREFLYGASEEVPDARIGWYFNVTDAYSAGIERQLPIVFVFAENWCYYCGELVKSLNCPAVNTLAGHAVFAIAGNEDAAAKAVMDKLDVEGYPAISILEPSTDAINERARMNGYFPGDTLSEHLHRVLAVATPRGGSAIAGMEYPAKLTMSAAACSQGTVKK